jgi:hypothetical protein
MPAPPRELRTSPPFRVQQTDGYVVLVIDVQRILEGSVLLRVTKRFFSVRFTALAADDAAAVGVGVTAREVHFELCSEVGVAAEGPGLNASGSRVRVASLNMTVTLAKVPSAAAGLATWSAHALPTKQSALVALAAALKGEAKQAAESAALDMTVRTWRLRAADLGICSDVGALASLQLTAGKGLGVMPAGPGALVPSLSSLFPTDSKVLSRLQVRQRSGPYLCVSRPCRRTPRAPYRTAPHQPLPSPSLTPRASAAERVRARLRPDRHRHPGAVRMPA